MENSIAVSVIIPIYNAEACLERCLDSIINQTLKEIEIICVDDASSDRSLEIVSSYTQKDNRVVSVCHDQNLSASIARKSGAKIARGEYILFVDPDDTIENNTLEIAYRTAIEKNVEIVHFGTNVINNGVTNEQVKWYKNFAAPYIGYIDHEDVFKKCFVTQEYRFNIWNKLIESELCKKAMNQCVDVPLPKAQDLYAYFLIAYYANSYYGIEDKLYNYYFGGGVSGGRVFDEKKFIRHCSQADVAYYIVLFLIREKSLNKYYKGVYKVINNLINDNIASLKACGKAKVSFSAEKIFADAWILGNLQTNLINYINKTYDDCCAKLLFEINFKIIKNISIKSRKLILEKLDQIFFKYSAILTDFEQKFDIQSKDYAFLQTLVAKKKYEKYGKTYIPIFLASNDNYMPYLGVTLNSLILNADKSYMYDIYIMHSGLNNYYINKIVKLKNEYIDVHCINVYELIKSQKLYSNRHYSIEMYYRFLIPELFFFMEKVLYLDCDLIVLDSVHKLFLTDISGYVLCAARNILHKEMSDYVIDTLSCNVNTYFNSGVLLINCGLFIEKNIKNKCYIFLNSNTNLACPDQDALNKCCDSVKLLDLSWNFQWHHLLNMSKQEKYKIVDNDRQIYDIAQKEAKIIHFTSNKKPWNWIASDYSDLFWQYAETSLFHREVFFKYMDLNNPIILKLQDLSKQLNALKKISNIESKSNKKGFFFKVKNGFSAFWKCLYENGIAYTFIRIIFGRERAQAFKEKKKKR